ncbi:MAG: hypothetical protein AAGA75_24160 [Cyanobacteria bacterium P01_E01_bin.6]
MLQRNKPGGYTPEEIAEFIDEWNLLCDARERNPYTSTRSRSFFLCPSSKFVDDPQLGVTAEERAERFLNYSPNKRRTTIQALAS